MAPDYFCEEVLEICPRGDYKELNMNDFINSILEDKPYNVKDDDYINSLYKDIQKRDLSGKVLRMAHFTDLHIDFDYTVGASRVCGQEEICCRP